jgi:hypothetical protein
MKSLLLNRLAVPRPQELQLFALTQGEKGVVHGSWGYYEDRPSGETLITSFSYPVYQQLRKQNHVLQDVFAFKNYGRMTATIDEKAEAVTTEMVSGTIIAPSRFIQFWDVRFWKPTTRRLAVDLFWSSATVTGPAVSAARQPSSAERSK